MPRNMSFSMTTEAVRDRTKSITRRLGWWNLEPGTILQAVEKGMGLKKGEKVKPICLIRVVAVTCESVGDIEDYGYYDGGAAEVRREGFDGMSAAEFVAMFCAANKCQRTDPVNRIEFEYVDESHD